MNTNNNNMDLDYLQKDLDDLEKELEIFEKRKIKNNIILIDDQSSVNKEKNCCNKQNINFCCSKKEQSTFEFDTIKDKSDKNAPKTNKKIDLLPEHYFISEYMTDTTKLILEIIDNFEYLNIDFQYAEDFMECDYKINKIFRYMNAVKKDGQYIFDNMKHN